MHYLLTKRKFILGLQCEKALYLDIYKPQLAYFPPETLARFRKGREFESKVKDMFPGGFDISKKLKGNIRQYPGLTDTLMHQQVEVTLFEAAFVHNEVLVLADVLHKATDGTVSVYEIKNSLSVKPVFRRDVCIQHYVISKCVDRLASFQVIYNDGNDNPLYEELLSEAEQQEPAIAAQVSRFKEVLQGLEPSIPVGDHCSTPYDCPYRRYCEGRKAVQLDLTL